jgi:putative transposase
MGISKVTFYNWKKKYGGLGTTELRRLRQLEDENYRLKKLVVDLSLDKHIPVVSQFVCLNVSLQY